MSFNIQNYPKLKQAIEKNNLVLFVGAGTSINLKNIKGDTLGNWSKLVEKVLHHLNEKNTGKFENLLPLIDGYDPIDILNLIEKNKNLEKRDVYDFLKDYLDLGDNELDVQKKITKLSNIIITTNYDTAFESCNKELSKRVAYKGKNYELATHKDDEKPLLFKLHGCFLDATSMVLFPSNYSDLYNNNANDAEHTLATLKNLVYNKSILFVGCGMGDFQINNIFREIKKILGEYSEHHFIISKTRPDSTLNFLTHIEIKDHGQLEEIVDSLIHFKESMETEKNKEKEEQQKEIDLLNVKLNENKSKNVQLIQELFQEATDYGNNKDYENAIKKYAQISYLEEYSGVFNNWGTALYCLAIQNVGSEKEEKLIESNEKYENAIEIDSNSINAFYNWGISIFELAKLKEGDERITLLKDCCKKHEEAIKIDPENPKPYYNCGTALAELGKMSEGLKQNEFYQLSEKKFLEGFKHGSKKIYNLSCLYALQNKKTEALKYLKLAFEGKEQTAEYVNNEDEDWNLLKQDLDFISIIEKYKSN